MRRNHIIPVRWIHDQHDTDQDGVPNYRDCDPWNPHKQHISKILHPGKVKCDECLKWFPKDEIEYYNTGAYCKNCIDKVKKISKQISKQIEAHNKYQMRVSNAEKRCPYCGNRKYRMIRKGLYDNTGDVCVCLRCHRHFLRGELSDWEMKRKHRRNKKNRNVYR